MNTEEIQSDIWDAISEYGMAERQAGNYPYSDLYEQEAQKALNAVGSAIEAHTAARDARVAELESALANLEAINARQAETVAMLKRVAPPLPRLWVSSTSLLDRFEAHPTIKQSIDRMMSEVAEFIVAANDTYGASTADIAEEAADVWVTVINVLRAANVSDAVFYEGLEAVMASNDKKTSETHQRSAQNGVERLPKVVNHE